VPIIEALECSGDPDQYVDKTQDKHIAHFCDLVANEYTPGSIGEVIYTYQDDTVESLNLRFYRRPNGKLTADVVKEQCLESIPKIFHGCDTSSRWKHGGYYRFTQGDEELYEYQVRPLHERPNPIPENPVAACEVWYKHEITEYVVDFTMSGGLFASDDYGREKLRPSLEKWCTSVKNWEFLYHQEPTRDTHFEWNAKGRFSSDAGLEAPMCVQQAIVDAGGPTVTCAFHWNAR
jgi:hypothetical protein